MAREVSRRRAAPRDADEDYVADEEESTRPIRRGRSRRDEEDETPRGRRSRRARDEEEERPARRSRRSRDDGDEDRPSRSEGFRAPSNTGRGRASVKRHRETHQSGDFAPRFSVDKEPVLVKFLDEEWFFTYYEHWIQEFRGEKRQQSFVCLGEDEGCPLCEIGDTAAFRALINVIDLSDPDDPQLKVWYATPNPIDAVEEHMDDEKYSPVNRDDLYFSVAKKKGKNGFTNYTVSLVKERDLDEDWGMEPLSKGELEDFESRKFNEDQCLRINTRRQLQDIADELTDD